MSRACHGYYLHIFSLLAMYCVAFGMGSLDVIYDWHPGLRECLIQQAFQRTRQAML
jgi:hypothetical protein